MGKRFWVALVLVAWVGSALAAGGPAAVRKQIESSLLVNGTIDITADGAVAGYVLKDADALPSGIRNMVASVVPKWRFEPVKLRPGATLARATMSLRFVAKKLENDDITIEIRGAHFSNEGLEKWISTQGTLAPPRYPREAALAGVGGTVYTVLKIGRDGHVQEAIAEQVNLRFVADENAMQRWRDMLAKVSLRAAKQWTFLPPTTGDDVDAPYWSARVPVDFVAPGSERPKSHKWLAYVPGPQAVIPWRNGESHAGADALAAGGVYPLDGGPKLLTALNPS
jgi:hypothetical protein